MSESPPPESALPEPALQGLQGLQGLVRAIGRRRPGRRRGCRHRANRSRRDRLETASSRHRRRAGRRTADKHNTGGHDRPPLRPATRTACSRRGDGTHCNDTTCAPWAARRSPIVHSVATPIAPLAPLPEPARKTRWPRSRRRCRRGGTSAFRLPLVVRSLMCLHVADSGSGTAKWFGIVDNTSTKVPTSRSNAVSTQLVAASDVSPEAEAPSRHHPRTTSCGRCAVTHLLGSVDVSAAATSPFAMPHPQPAAYITTVIGTGCENFRNSCRFVDDRRRPDDPHAMHMSRPRRLMA